MPEQAQRRAPVDQFHEASPAEKPADNNTLEELRHLIVSPEQEGIAEIRHRMDNLERRAEDVSSVVAEAIQMRRDQGDDRALADALAPTIQETLRESVRRDPHTLADALFPVMGPAIRKSISEALRSMVESFNEALEHSLSVQGLRWRIEAFRTGKPFAEIVLMHSLVYRVEQVFLIHRETGLVLHHLVAPAVATQDPAMVAGMLSAIQQFVKDSFESQRGETLGSLDVGELHVWVEEGPDAVIAAVIRGHAPSDFRVALKEALEAVQQQYASALDKFQGDAAPFRGAGERLGHLLETRLRDKDAAARGKKRRPRAAIAAGLMVLAIVVAWLAVSIYQQREWSQYADALRREPGITVTSFGKSGGKWQIRGVRDPLAAKPEDLLAHAGLNPARADIELAPVYSLDDAIVLKRAEGLLAPPSGVSLVVMHGTLVASGSAASRWIGNFADRARWVPGVTSVDASQLNNADAEALGGIVLTFPVGSPELEAGQNEKLARAEYDIRAILESAIAAGGAAAPAIEITGHTDSTGVEGTNLALSNQRAARVMNLFVRAGLSAAPLRTRGVGTSMPLRTDETDEGRHLNRSVTFKVIFTASSSSSQSLPAQAPKPASH
ncbi:MAG TPA: OmpA family protein [Candidatus Acidoferrales bacterium]|nr:OmpA family protein [Candidatus Acidoferrales bacterium]